MKSKALFVLFLVVAIFVATEARHLHCGKSLARFIQKTCHALCEGGVDIVLATYACTQPVTADYIREKCFPAV